MASLIYRHPRLYHWVMRILYAPHFESRYREVASLIEAGASVADLCAGDAYIFRRYLRNRVRSYIALDNSPQMVSWARARRIEARLFDVWDDPLPEADYVMMQASLCQFIPRAGEVLERMLQAARRGVIVAEPVRNWSTSSNPVLSFLGRRLTRPHGQGEYAGERFTERSLLELFGGFPEFERSFLVPGGREMIGVFKGRAAGCALSGRVS